MDVFLADLFASFGFGEGQLVAVVQVIFIDLVLAGDNAIVVGMAAAGTPSAIRRKVIVYGIAGAVVLRIGLALVTTSLLNIVGLLFAGGVLLLWVCWKLYREMRASAGQRRGVETLASEQASEMAAPTKTFGAAMRQIVVADISMSLDNLLAVAGAAREHPYILIAGLLLSVVLMGAAATLIARVLDRHRWIAWLGLLMILYVAVRMMWDGAFEIHEVVGFRPLLPFCSGALRSELFAEICIGEPGVLEFGRPRASAAHA